MSSLGSILVLVECIYALIIISFAFAWRKIEPFNLKTGKRHDIIPLSIVVALRNEAENVKRLISDFAALHQNHCTLEVILVNDHSNDQTYTMATSLSANYNWITVLNLVENSGKKAAQKKGAESTTGELILFTDADCSIPNNWADFYAIYYQEKNNPDLIIGLVDMQPSFWYENFFRLEFLSLVLSGAAAYALKTPVYCNGANMAVKASVYKTYDPDYAISSGDDVFLLHEIKKQNGAVELLKSKDHLVKTPANKSLGSFLNQRTRWSSKSYFYKDPATNMLAILVLLSNLILLAAFLGLFIQNSMSIVLLIIALKILPDLILFLSGKDFFSYHKILFFYPILAVLYPIYVLFTAVLAIKKPFQWKGRKVF